jgi:hypothetical protein
MDLGNLATVICPSILYSRSRDAVRDESFGAIRVVTALLENQDVFFTVPEEFLPVLHDPDYFVNSMDLPSKDFMKKCDTFMRTKAANGRPPAGTTPFASSHNSSQSRFPAPNSPNPDRPSGSSSSERMRPPFGVPPSNATHLSLNSPSLPRDIAQNPPRTPQMDEWPAAARPANSGSPSRPSSYVQTARPGADHPNSFSPNPSSYPSAVRQRT